MAGKVGRRQVRSILICAGRRGEREALVATAYLGVGKSIREHLYSKMTQVLRPKTVLCAPYLLPRLTYNKEIVKKVPMF